jgi:hypothetical protein
MVSEIRRKRYVDKAKKFLIDLVLSCRKEDTDTIISILNTQFSVIEDYIRRIDK